MKNDNYLFTSESVTEGHPDKLADQVSDAILDEILAKDPVARVAVETLVTTGMVLVSGEITTSCYVDIPVIVRKTIQDIGYTRAKYGFDSETCAVLTSIDEQSPDIAIGVDTAWEVRSKETKEDSALGAGDQGMMFGFACDETPSLMPMPITLAHSLTKRLAEVRRDKTLPYLRPDGKAQVTVEYDGKRPVRVDTVVVAAQHKADISYDRLKEDIIREVVRAAIPAELLDEETKYYINPSGRFVVGGPQGDTGLTGRKIIVDTYGGYARHGGGAFSGKDPTKVDRTASYGARWVAKNIVAGGLAEKCEVQLAYALGVAKPVAINIETFGSGRLSNKAIGALVSKHFDLSSTALINELNLRRPIYRQIASYGHMGRIDLDLPWERTDKAAILRQEAGL